MWSCLTPFQGVLPSFPLLVILLVFEILVCLRLSGAEVITPYECVAPLLMLQVLFLCGFAFLATTSTVTGVVILCGTAVTVLVPAKLAGDLPGARWLEIMIPLFVLDALLALKIVWMLGNHALYRRGAGPGRLWFAPWQLWCVAGYSAALAAFFVAQLRLSQKLDGSKGVVWTHVLLPLAIAFLAFSAALAFAAYRFTREFLARLRTARGVTPQPGADIDGKPGETNWMLLGSVKGLA